MSEVSILSEYEPVVVDLWGAKYETKELGKKGVTKLAAVEKEIGEFQVTDAASLDEFVAKFGEFVDVKLKPVKGKVKASTHLKKQWDADNLTDRQLGAFLVNLKVAEEEANRPF